MTSHGYTILGYLDRSESMEIRRARLGARARLFTIADKTGDADYRKSRELVSEKELGATGAPDVSAGLADVFGEILAVARRRGRSGIVILVHAVASSTRYPAPGT